MEKIIKYAWYTYYKGKCHFEILEKKTGRKQVLFFKRNKTRKNRFQWLRKKQVSEKSNCKNKVNRKQEKNRFQNLPPSILYFWCAGNPRIVRLLEQREIHWLGTKDLAQFFHKKLWLLSDFHQKLQKMGNSGVFSTISKLY